MSSKDEHADVGVIVARFQTHELHEGQRLVLDTVRERHDKYIVFLGLSPTCNTLRNPLDFQARKQMVLEEYPEANVLYLKDMPDDHVWSKKLDDQIADLVGPNSTVMLYGGRESFVPHYHGKWPTAELEQVGFLSATAIRKEIARSTKNDASFRAGVIWASYNRYPMLIPTVDIAIWNDDGTKLLLGRKPNEKGWRFIGGFAQPGADPGARGCYEAQVRKEVHEEAGIEVTEPQYITSMVVDDWRYRGEADKIATLLFECRHMFGAPKPGDDIEELKWFDVDPNMNLEIQVALVPQHKPLFAMLMDSTKIGAVD